MSRNLAEKNPHDVEAIGVSPHIQAGMLDVCCSSISEHKLFVFCVCLSVSGAQFLVLVNLHMELSAACIRKLTALDHPQVREIPDSKRN